MIVLTSKAHVSEVHCKENFNPFMRGKTEMET